MPTDYHGFLTNGDHDKIDEGLEELSAQDRAEAKYDIRKRTARGLRDLEIVSRELNDSDHGNIAVEWFELDQSRSPVERMPDIFSMLWTGLNLKSHEPRESDDGYVVMGEGEDAEFVPEEVARPGYDAVDWENWLERAIRSSQPSAYVNVSIDQYTDLELDELEKEYRDGEGVKPDELTALVRTGRIELDEYNELGGLGAVPRITEP